MYVAKLYSLTSAETTFQEGEIGALQDNSYPLEFEGYNPQVAFKVMADHFGLKPSDFEIYDHFPFGLVLETGFLSDRDGNQASQYEIAEWKQGRKRLWNSFIQIKLYTVSLATADDYRKALSQSKSNPRKRKNSRKANPRRRKNSAAQRRAQSNASKAMKLYQSGKAKTLKSAWRMVKRGS